VDPRVSLSQQSFLHFTGNIPPILPASSLRYTTARGWSLLKSSTVKDRIR
jgi:hypothetical protein